jgi:hypothetical protein
LRNCPARTSAVDASVTAADELFVNLDGSILKVRDSSWRVDICGVHSVEQRHWVQVHLVGPEEYGVTVTTERLSARRIREQLFDWLSTTAPATAPLIPPAFA